MGYTTPAFTKTATPGPDAGSTSAQDTTTGDITLIVIGVAWYPGFTADVTVSDSESNTWTPLTKKPGACSVQLFYCLNPTLSASHTFSVAGGGTYPAIMVQGWPSGSEFDQENGTIGVGGTQMNTGSVTPSVSNELIVTVLGVDVERGAASIDSGFTISADLDYTSGVNMGGALAYKVTSSVSNPLWSWVSSVTGNNAVIATFEAALPAGAGGPIIQGGSVMHGALRGRIVA
jgi:hypothetical protein